MAVVFASAEMIRLMKRGLPRSASRRRAISSALLGGSGMSGVARSVPPPPAPAVAPSPPPPPPPRVSPPPPRPPPLGEALHEPPCAPAPSAELLDGVVGHQAVRSAAVRDDLFPRGQHPDPLLELLERHGERARDVPGSILLGWPDVDHDHTPLARAPPPLLARPRLALAPG